MLQTHYAMSAPMSKGKAQASLSLCLCVPVDMCTCGCSWVCLSKIWHTIDFSSSRPSEDWVTPHSCTGSQWVLLCSVTQSWVPQVLCSDHVRSGHSVFAWLLRPEKPQIASLLTLACDIEMLRFIFLFVFLGNVGAKGSLATDFSSSRLLP